MAEFQRISIAAANDLMAQGAQLADVRDRQSYEAGHIAGASHLDNDSLGGFIQQADLTLPLVVYCYHGNSSQGAAAYLSEQGFAEVYSMDGGFEQWRLSYPVTT